MRPIRPHESSYESRFLPLAREPCPKRPCPGPDPGHVPRECRKRVVSVPRRNTPGCFTYARLVPRQPRLQIPGGIYHLGTRGVRRMRIYGSSGDYELFGNIFDKVVERFGWRCHTYCLMPNHYHLLVETPGPNLSAGMQQLNGIYGQWYNQLYGFSGHVFERRFFSRLVESSYDLLRLARYIDLNPVRASLCEDASD